MTEENIIMPVSVISKKKKSNPLLVLYVSLQPVAFFASNSAAAIHLHGHARNIPIGMTLVPRCTPTTRSRGWPEDWTGERRTYAGGR